MRLAREIVSIFHSPDAAAEAQNRWDEVFRGGKGVPDNIADAAVTPGEEIRDVLLRLGMVGSRGEARRLIQQGGVRVDDVKVDDIRAVIQTEQLPAILQVGKRQFARLAAAE